MKKLFKKLSGISQETKVGLTIALIAVIFFGGIGISQRWWKPTDSTKTSTTSASNSGNSTSSSSSSTRSSTSSSNVPVVSPLDEVFGYPCTINATIVRFFFDVNEQDNERLAASVVYYGNKYLPSQGIDIVANDNSQFNVLATVSGTITEKVQDAKYGLMLTLQAAGNLKLTFSSLSSAQVNVGDIVKKGDLLGKAGQAAYGADLGKNHLHLEAFVADNIINPEQCFTKTIGDIVN